MFWNSEKKYFKYALCYTRTQQLISKKHNKLSSKNTERLSNLTVVNSPLSIIRGYEIPICHWKCSVELAFTTNGTEVTKSKIDFGRTKITNDVVTDIIILQIKMFYQRFHWLA